MIQFILNQKTVVLQDPLADGTVLDYLRNQKNLCGTKEGCASGDCGACTVVLAEPSSDSSDSLEYRAINSCITFIGALHGKQLITVEHLAGSEQLHAVQQAMVDLHGSQCGFCTPGFVMSLFALYKSIDQTQEKQDKHHLDIAIEDSLGGNLCRCTGYRPIVDAARASLSAVNGDQFSDGEKSVFDRLTAISAVEQSSETANSLLPESVETLISNIKNNPQARLVAGSTDLALEVTQQLKAFPKLIHLERVTELKSVSQTNKELEIGAAISLSRCRQHITEHYPESAELFDRFGSKQIRNNGTIGGNIANASPIGDLPPLLLAMNARLRLQLSETIRELPVQEFFLDYKKTALITGEFIRSVVIPKPSGQQHFRVYKVSKRIDDDISAVCMAISIELSDHDRGKILNPRIALGGMAAIPKHAAKTEQILVGKQFNVKAIEAAAEVIATEFSPISDARASAEYRIQIVQNLLHRFYYEISQPHLSVRVSKDG